MITSLTKKPQVKVASTFNTDDATLESMSFYLSEDIAASCWNCSSPFLKKGNRIVVVWKQKGNVLITGMLPNDKR